MRIATWNVNSLRSRIDRVEAFLQRHEVDVLAVQETKAREDQLPLMGLQSLGYDVAAVGYNQWNGVAVISRVGLEEVSVGFPGMPGWGDPIDAEARAIGAVAGGVRVWSLYVPNGRKVDDPHYVYKLDWLARLREASKAWLGEPTALDICSRYDIHALVLVVIMPFYAKAGTFETPDTAAIGRLFLDARRKIADRQVLLGCARPAGMHKRVTDAYAVMAGLDGIAFPADGAVAVAEAIGRPADQQHACCSMKLGGETVTVPSSCAA